MSLTSAEEVDAPVIGLLDPLALDVLRDLAHHCSAKSGHLSGPAMAKLLHRNVSLTALIPVPRPDVLFSS